MITTITREELQNEANFVFRNGYTWGETVVYVLNKCYDLQLPDVSIALSSGFPYGFGVGGNICGAVAGTTMILGSVFGRTKRTDPLPQKCLDVTRELNDYIVAHRKTVICPEYIQDYTFATPERKDHCTELIFDILEIFAKIMERERGITIQ